MSVSESEREKERAREGKKEREREGEKEREEGKQLLRDLTIESSCHWTQIRETTTEYI